VSDRFLITQSLLSSWKYQFSEFYDIYDNSDSAEKAIVRAQEDFLAALRREQTPTTDAMQRGHDFEELVTLLAEDASDFDIYDIEPQFSMGGSLNDDGIWETRKFKKPQWARWYDGARQIADKVRGGVFQVKINQPLVVGNTEFLLHGRIDVLKFGTIHDIKFASRYEYGNYIDSAQHPMYFAIVPEAHTFSYQVYRDGFGAFEESYRREDTRDVAEIITEFMEYLHARELIELYQQHWLAR